MIKLNQIELDIRRGLPEAHTGWIQQSKEWDYYCNRGAALVGPRAAEDPQDFAGRPKISVKILHQVVTKLAAGIYGRGGPCRRLTDPAADELYQRVITEHKMDRYLHRIDALTWLHGYSALQVLPQTDRAKLECCPVQLRAWRADELYVWTDDSGVCPEAVLTRSVFPRRRQIRFQVWTAEELGTYYSNVGDLDLTGSGTHEFTLSEGESGENPLGCIPFCFFHNDHPVDTFFTPGIGRPLSETSLACDRLLSNLHQALDVFCIPTQYADNLSVQARLYSRPGNVVDLVPKDDTRDVRVFFAQPVVDVESTWRHVQNILNSDLAGLNLPLTMDLEASTQPESGVALAIRWLAPMVDLFRGRQEQYKHHETCLARLVARVGGFATGTQALADAAEGLKLEVDYPEPRLPIPSPERDLQDQTAIEQGWSSAIMVIQQRYGKTRRDAIEFLKQVQEDQAELVRLAVPAPAAPPLAALPEPDRLVRAFETGERGDTGPELSPMSNSPDLQAAAGAGATPA